MNTPNLQETIARMKSEILADIVAGTVPASVSSFSELHDYVDANEYGGFCDDDHEPTGRILELQNERDSLTEEQERNWPKAGELEELQEQYTAFANAAQTAVNTWLVAGGHKRPVWDSSGLPEGEAKKAAEAKAARMWCYVTTDGRAFYVEEFAAKKMLERSGGQVFPPL
jgi:hypothetical protein